MGLQLMESRSSSSGFQVTEPTSIRNGLHIQVVNGQGLGVFTRRRYQQEDLILEFSGDETPLNQISNFTHYMQISPQMYLGPSHQMDDYVNHSCDPNSAVYFQNNVMVLRALRQIEINEQLSFDYGTIIFNEPTVFECACNSDCCRRVIGNFYTMPLELQNDYLEKGMVPLLAKYTREQLGF